MVSKILFTRFPGRIQGYIQDCDVAGYGAPLISELTQWSGSLTPLASDLGQAHQSTFVRYIYRQLTTPIFLINTLLLHIPLLALTADVAEWLDRCLK
jgi:hypothetical protein